MKNVRQLLLFAIISLFFQSAAYAGTGSTDTTFDALVNLLQGYLTGSFGLAISMASVVAGAIAALYTKTLMFLGFGFAMAIGLVYVPDILVTFFTATI